MKSIKKVGCRKVKFLTKFKISTIKTNQILTNAFDNAVANASITVPAMRRVFPQLILQDICNVQPMSEPNGNIVDAEVKEFINNGKKKLLAF